MSVREGIWCACGRRITIRDVLQHGFVMARWVPRFVFVQYRCPRCQATAREMVQFEQWNSALLDPPDLEPTPEEWERFEELGEISHEEMIEFGRLLRTADPASLDEFGEDD